LVSRKFQRLNSHAITCRLANCFDWLCKKSIFLRSIDPTYLLINLSWIIGSCGTLVFDFTVSIASDFNPTFLKVKFANSVPNHRSFYNSLSTEKPVPK
jgi:hypothetical protein